MDDEDGYPFSRLQKLPRVEPKSGQLLLHDYSRLDGLLVLMTPISDMEALNSTLTLTLVLLSDLSYSEAFQAQSDFVSRRSDKYFRSNSRSDEDDKPPKHEQFGRSHYSQAEHVV